ncbi:uncharacterized protein A4U43_C07F17520 [Asparagus officinalis]|uniref:Uncharacterized protein n=1 Tax=Asparagus officinalis TaxID=4686 RepID=A0A5P1ECQ2_ASPOF|nr:uncharacterized protein A4U43_C07F17520 [Asparagus officinalis]
MAEDERKKEKPKQGGLRTMPFILGNEICDKFATAGFNANLVSYLTSQLHLPLVAASNTLSNFSGTSSLTTIIGALLADSYIGRFWTITVGSLIYQLRIGHRLTIPVFANVAGRNGEQQEKGRRDGAPGMLDRRGDG